MISFIVPVHNEQVCLGRALEAIHESASAVGQPYEMIVVDDASTDSTAEIARKYNATVLSVSHRQIAATRNSGGRAAHGDRLFFVDADTFISPQLLAGGTTSTRQWRSRRRRSCALEPPVPLYARLLVFFFSIFMRIAGLSGGAFMFCTRDAFNAVGGFDERLYAAKTPRCRTALKREGPLRPAVDAGTHIRSCGRGRTSGLAMMWFFLSMAFVPLRKLRRRSSVEKMWYESDREGNEKNFNTLAFKASNFAASRNHAATTLWAALGDPVARIARKWLVRLHSNTRCKSYNVTWAWCYCPVLIFCCRPCFGKSVGSNASNSSC